jgi:hypothetical protein
MNRTLLSSILALALVGSFAASVQSQTAVTPKSTLQQLQEMKTRNTVTLEKQEALLLKLEDLNKEASQIKFLTKRG